MSADAPSGAWLLIERDGQSPVALPVPRQACLGLTRAVLFRGGADEAALDAVRVFAGGDPGIEQWLAASSQGPGGPRSSLVRRLAETLILADDLRSGRAEAARFIDAEACRSPADEALVLRDAVRAAAALEACEGRFQAAVAEARLAAMRELAYGAGHEINNPLANIAARAQAMLLEEIDPERRRRLSTIVDQAFRARDMIGGLMLFARPPKPIPRETDVGELVAAVVSAARPLAAARGARLDYDPPQTAIAARVDATQIGEAVRALVVNAIEAVEPGGRVTVAVHPPSLGDEATSGCSLSLEDDGHGMDEETAKRAFDPFFSGREAGRGIGLGLSKAWRLIDSNGGRVFVESRRGRGTRVTVNLPRPDAEQAGICR